MNVDPRRRRLLKSLGALAAGVAAGPHAAFAADYPSRAIKLINPFAPGGSADIISRLFATKLSEIIKETMFVDYSVGAGGTIGSERVVQSPPDGYTLLLSNVASQAIAPSIYPSLPYNPLDDFVHIAMLGAFPNVLVVGPTMKSKDVPTFVADLKAKPGVYNFGSAGVGSTPQLSAELLRIRTGAEAKHVPFKGAGPALLAVMAGQIDFQFENISTALPQIRSGKLRALGVTSAQRVSILSEVPTMEEQGIPDFVVESWYGLSAPAKTAAAATQAIARATTTALADPAMLARLTELGVTKPAFPPAGYREFIDREIRRWATIIKQSDMKAS